MSTAFILYALPRSRTRWLSEFLSYKDFHCCHEQAVTMRSLDDVRTFFGGPNIGTVETAAIYGRVLIKHIVPDIREVVILQDVDKAVDRMMKTDTGGIATYDKNIVYKTFLRADRLLRKAASDPNVLTVDYNDLDKEETCKTIFEHCLPYPFDREYWKVFKDWNIQINIKDFMLYYSCNKDKVEAFKAHCKSELRKLVRDGLIWQH